MKRETITVGTYQMLMPTESTIYTVEKEEPGLPTTIRVRIVGTVTEQIVCYFERWDAAYTDDVVDTTLSTSASDNLCAVVVDNSINITLAGATTRPVENDPKFTIAYKDKSEFTENNFSYKSVTLSSETTDTPVASCWLRVGNNRTTSRLAIKGGESMSISASCTVCPDDCNLEYYYVTINDEGEPVTHTATSNYLQPKYVATKAAVSSNKVDLTNNSHWVVERVNGIDIPKTYSNWSPTDKTFVIDFVNENKK